MILKMIRILKNLTKKEVVTVRSMGLASYYIKLDDLMSSPEHERFKTCRFTGDTLELVNGRFAVTGESKVCYVIDPSICRFISEHVKCGNILEVKGAIERIENASTKNTISYITKVDSMEKYTQAA